MIISHKKLQELTPFTFKPSVLSEKLTMLGLEVEKIIDFTSKLDRIVVGQVVEKVKHPKADKLSLCKVDVGGASVLQIVCGAPNVAAGQRVPVALEGAVMFGGELIIKPTKLRGELSEGMICSEDELGLGEDKSGIMVLNGEAAHATLGTPLAQALKCDDVVYEIGITPNRADCLSHVGIAREIAALTGKKVSLPKISFKEISPSARAGASVEIKDAVACPRYIARIVRNVKIGPSPAWLVNFLRSVGIRSVNNVVDVTNYVLMECGQPLHAFDYDKLDGHGIIVRRSTSQEKFTTLDGKERAIPPDSILICDKKKAVALAGVMGGMNSEISDLTTTVLIESAIFEPASIRRTSKALGLTSDASYRFERGVDIERLRWACDRAAQLIQELAGGEILRGAIDVYPKKQKIKKITVRPARVRSLLGIELPTKRMTALLGRLGIKSERITEKNFSAIVPTHRNDLDYEVDIIEEIARLHGYNNIPAATVIHSHLPSEASRQSLASEFRTMLVARGWTEMLTPSMLSRARAEKFSDAASLLEIANPVSEDLAVMRPSLVPSALDVVSRNHASRRLDLRLFETAHIYRIARSGEKKTVSDIKEEEYLVMVASGARAPRSWAEQSAMVDLFDMKGEIEMLVETIGIKTEWKETKSDNHFSYGSEIIDAVTKKSLGFVGILDKTFADQMNIRTACVVAELSLESLEELGIKKRPFYHAPSRYPGVDRDIAIVVPRSTSAESWKQCIRKAADELLLGVSLFDMYAGEKIDPSKKSLAFSLHFGSYERTLEEHEIDTIIKKIIDRLQTEGATLRA